MANALGNMGNVCHQQGELGRALEFYEQAYDVAERLGDPRMMAGQLGNIGNVYRRQGELGRALECYQQAYAVSERLKDPEIMAIALASMGLIYAQQGDLEKARQHLEQAQTLYQAVGIKGEGPDTVAHALEALEEIEKALALTSEQEPPTRRKSKQS